MTVNLVRRHPLTIPVAIAAAWLLLGAVIFREHSLPYDDGIVGGLYAASLIAIDALFDPAFKLVRVVYPSAGEIVQALLASMVAIAFAFVLEGLGRRAWAAWKRRSLE